MDTKWKSTTNDEIVVKWKNSNSKLTSWIKKYRNIIITCVSGFLGLWGLGITMLDAYIYNTFDMISLGFISNIFIGIALVFGLKIIIARYYGNWIPEDESFYDEWKAMRCKLNKILLIVFGSLFLVSFILFYSFYDVSGASFCVLLMLSIIVQFIISEASIMRYMDAKLEVLMKHMTEINEKNLQTAIAIEKESIESAVKSERLKVDLISNVSHDLKTPLTSMIGYIELLKKEKLNKVSRDYAEVISNKAEKLAEMIENLFSLAKASSGNITLNPEPVQLNTLIEQISADMVDQIEASGLDFVTILTTDETRIITDNNHMYRICQNLIENALKYSSPHTRVFIKTFTEKIAAKEKICLEITNTSGYPLDFDKEDIIERFARGDKARSGDGNGLGLAIVNTYTTALGGTFDIIIDCDQFKAILTFPAG